MNQPTSPTTPGHPGSPGSPGPHGPETESAEFHEHVVSTGKYVLIYVLLMLLLGATVGVYFVDLGAANTAVALIIATIKASLVVMIFMHVKYSSRMTWLFAGAGLAWLFIMMVLTFNDYFSRGWHMP